MLFRSIRRDKLDSTRKESPLIKAEDAIEIDSSYLTIEEVVELMIQYLEDKHVI